MRGIDVSVHNNDRYIHRGRRLPWDKIKAAGVEFVIVRTGAGLSLEDEDFQQTVMDAKSYGLKVGAYHYSYALTPATVMREATVCKQIIQKSGVLLDLPVFLDMEDDDQYKYRHGFTFTKQNITKMCKAWIEAIKPYNTGLYACLDWLENYIDWQSLVAEYHIPVWNAQYSNNDYLQGYIWQFTNNLIIDGNPWDGNIMYDDTHKVGLDPWKVFVQS